MFISRSSQFPHVPAGIGASVALPPARSHGAATRRLAKTAANARLRFGVVHSHGAIMDRYTPRPKASASPSQIRRWSRSRIRHGREQSHRPGNDDSHATASAAWLSGPWRSGPRSDFELGTTIDQVIAKQIDRTRRSRRSKWRRRTSPVVGGCSPGDAWVYMNTIAWARPQPVPMEINPRVVWSGCSTARHGRRAGPPMQQKASVLTRSRTTSAICSATRRERPQPAQRIHGHP